MRDRPSPPSRSGTGRPAPFTVDVVVFSPRERGLGVLCPRAGRGAKERRGLPYGAPRDGETLERCARRLVREAAGVEPSWIEQVGAFADGKRHPSDSDLSIGFVAVMPSSSDHGGRGDWATLGELGALSPRQRAIADGALSALRTRMDHAPIAFRFPDVNVPPAEGACTSTVPSMPVCRVHW